LQRGFGRVDGTMHLEDNVESWKRTAAILFISVILMREGGRGPCLGAFGVCGVDMKMPLPLPLLQWSFKHRKYKTG